MVDRDALGGKIAFDSSGCVGRDQVNDSGVEKGVREVNVARVVIVGYMVPCGDVARAEVGGCSVPSSGEASASVAVRVRSRQNGAFGIPSATGWFVPLAESSMACSVAVQAIRGQLASGD